ALARSLWGETEANPQLFLPGRTPPQLGGVVNYLTIEGEPRAYPLWQLMLQQVNHATQHRSEAAVRLTQFGPSPADLDFLFYLRQQTEEGSELSAGLAAIAPCIPALKNDPHHSGSPPAGLPAKD